MNRRILVIDDEPNLRAVMRLTLEAAGYAVGEAENGRAGLEAFGDGANWDLVLLDQAKCELNFTIIPARIPS